MALLESSEKINATISKIMQVKMKHLKPVIMPKDKKTVILQMRLLPMT
jgi:hypothetical protein